MFTRLGYPRQNVVYELEPDEEGVGCYYCIEDGYHRSYKRGEAYLAGPGHSPLDGNANFICKDHLDSDAVIVDVTGIKP